MENQIEIVDTETIQNDNEIEDQQIISLNKFILLSILSFGLYEVWWIYKAWRFFKQKDKLDIMPAVRAILTLFFIWQLFDKILGFAKEKGYDKDYASGLLFTGFFLISILGTLPEPYFLIALFIFVVFIPPFNALNYAKENSTEFVVNEQKSFNGRQIAIIVIGAIFWILFIIGLNID